jgi:ppGpp synthetase/RelA/SpoT-type nucleotidyltranferase
VFLLGLWERAVWTFLERGGMPSTFLGIALVASFVGGPPGPLCSRRPNPSSSQAILRAPIPPDAEPLLAAPPAPPSFPLLEAEPLSLLRLPVDGEDEQGERPPQVLLPCLGVPHLWASLSDVCTHLDEDDCESLRGALELLLDRVGLAVRAAQLEAREAGYLVGADASRKYDSAFESLAVIAAVQTARDMLALRLDAPTIAAVLLSECISERTPTWPSSSLSDTFKLEVTSLLDQVAALRTLQRLVPDLGDGHALQVRGALMAAVGPPEAVEPLEMARDGVGHDDGPVVDSACAGADPGLPGDADCVTAVDADDGGGLAGGFDAAALGADPRALLVLLGSSLARLRSAEMRPTRERHALAIEAVQLYVPLATSVGFGDAFAELETLAYAQLFPSALRRLQRWYREVWPDAELVVRSVVGAVEAQLDAAPSLVGLLERAVVTGRVKAVPSAFRKLLRDGSESVSELRDVVALRVILTPSSTAVDTLEALRRSPVSAAEAEALLCHAAYRLITKLWPEAPGRFKDFVTRPKPNGYQSIHTNLMMGDGRVVEVQIRTAEMHERATVGTAAHQSYRATQLAGGLSQCDGVTRRTTLALKGVQRALPSATSVSTALT